MAKKTTLFRCVGNREMAVKAFAEQSRAKHLYILRMKPEVIKPSTDPDEKVWGEMTWKITYVTGVEAQNINKQMEAARG